MRPKRMERGFTLIELLTVSAITAVSLGLLLPAVTAANVSARSTACRNNLRCWGVGLWSYMAAHDGAIPRRGQGIQPVARIDRDEDWFNCLPPYAGEQPYRQRVAGGNRPRPRDGSLFVCPEARDDRGEHFFSYAMNMYLSPWIRPAPHRLMEVADPAVLVFMADSPGPYSATVPSKEPYSVVARHNGKANLLFLDSHVESRDGAYLGCGVGDPGRPDVRWQTDSPGVNQSPVR